VKSSQLEATSSAIQKTMNDKYIQQGEEFIGILKDLRESAIRDEIQGAVMEQVAQSWADSILSGNRVTSSPFDSGSIEDNTNRLNPAKNKDKLDRLLGRGKYQQFNTGQGQESNQFVNDAIDFSDFVIATAAIGAGYSAVTANGIAVAAFTGAGLAASSVSWGLRVGKWIATKWIPNDMNDSQVNPLNNIALYVLMGLSVNNAFNNSIIIKPILTVSTPGYENSGGANIAAWAKLDAVFGGYVFRSFLKDLEGRKNKAGGSGYSDKDKKRYSLSSLKVDVSKCPDVFEGTNFNQAIKKGKVSIKE